MSATATFKKLSDTERDQLRAALHNNAMTSAPLFTGRDTSFVPFEQVKAAMGREPEVVDDDEVICAVRSVPCHYAR